MKFTYNWLKDFVDIKLKPEALADALTMGGLEVKNIEQKGGDYVFEAEVTSNRPDCLSIVGIAQEVAAVTGAKLKIPVLRKPKVAWPALSFSVSIADRQDCPLYTAKIIRGVRVGPSPRWLAQRLEAIGCRSVNNIVDITNYILFTWGEPLHAFDLDKLSGSEITVRRARNNEKLRTIDDVERTLDPNMLVIADAETAVAIAGVMGGKDTEVAGRTKNILLEAALFNPVLIRRIRQALGMQTDSAYRFERGVDAQTIERASWEAVRLIMECCQGELVLAKGAAPKKKLRKIVLSAVSVRRVIGIDCPSAQIITILKNLGCSVKSKAGGRFEVTVPGQRPDLLGEIDLIEEISRIYGYERIPTTVPAITSGVRIHTQTDAVKGVKDILVSLGLHEVVTYSLVDAQTKLIFNPAQRESVAIRNPLSRDQEILRTSLVPSLARAVSYNLSLRQEYVGIFEIAGVFSERAQGPLDELHLGIAVCGRKPFFYGQGIIIEEGSFLALKGILQALCARFGVSPVKFSSLNQAGCVDIMVGPEKIGSMVSLAKPALDRLDIKGKEVFVAEVALAPVLAASCKVKSYIPAPKFPAVTRDISLVLKDSANLDAVIVAMKEAAGFLREVQLVDYYRGQQIPSGWRGITVSCLYRSDDRTLTEQEVAPFHQKVCTVLTERFGAKLR